jgi:hypothetical protein
VGIAFKLHLAVAAGSGAPARPHSAPANPDGSYNLDEDPSRNSPGRQAPGIVRELTAMMEAHQKTVEPFENQLSGRGRGARAGRGAA